MKYISFIILLSTYLFSVDYGTARNQILFEVLEESSSENSTNENNNIEKP